MVLYADYMQSEAWKLVRQRFFASKRFKGMCKCCKIPLKTYQTFIHHKTYSNLGKEKLKNLEALCKNCHYLVHFDNGVRLPLTPETLNNRLYQLFTNKGKGFSDPLPLSA